MELKASLEFVRDEAALDISDDDDTAAEIVGILLLLLVPVPLPPKDVIFLSWFIVDFAIRISILGDCCHFSWRRRQRRIVLGLFVVIVVAAVSCVQKMLKCFCCLFCLLAVRCSLSACLCLHCVLSIVSVDDFVVFETIIFYSICCYFLFTHSTFLRLVLCLFLAIILTQLLVSLPFNYLTAV